MLVGTGYHSPSLAKSDIHLSNPPHPSLYFQYGEYCPCWNLLA
jgi:hypothetical protein